MESKAQVQKDEKKKDVSPPNPECLKRSLKLDYNGEVKILKGLPERFGPLRNRTSKKYEEFKEQPTNIIFAYNDKAGDAIFISDNEDYSIFLEQCLKRKEQANNKLFVGFSSDKEFKQR
jgi:hypothetical protein